MKTRKFQWMAALVMGMAMTCVTMTSCSKEDNPVDDVPSVGQTTVKELSVLTTEEIGWVIADDSKAYPNAAAARAAGAEPLAMMAYVGPLTTYGLAIQLRFTCDVNWNEANQYVKNLPQINNAQWSLPTKEEWKNMVTACKVSEDLKTVTEMKMTPINGFKNKFEATGEAWEDLWYWTKDEDGSDRAYVVSASIQNPSLTQLRFGNSEPKSYPYAARAVLYFSLGY